MMRRMGLASFVLLAALLALGTVPATASAAFDLQITEIWAGSLPGAEYTDDWFELTNVGDMGATGLDGTLFFDDSHQDPTEDTALTGIDTIAPGESVIYLIDPGAGASAFLDMWGPLPGVQIGTVPGGHGLGGGDEVNIYDGNLATAILLDSAAYSVDPQVESFVSAADGSWVENTFAQVGVLGAYAGNLNATDDPSVGPPIGSPGRIAGVPEPGSIALMILGVAGVLACRRR